MKTLPERGPKPQELDRAITIVAASLIILTTRDGIFVPSDLVLERARNIVTALGADFNLVPLPALTNGTRREARR